MCSHYKVGVLSFHVTLVKCVLLLLCYHLPLGGAVSEFTSTVYSTESSADCGQYNPLHDQGLMKELIETVARIPRTGTHWSCAAILNGNPSAPSGYYNITTTNGSSVQIYCGTNCGGEGGWTRVAYVNMTQPGATCPQGLEQQSLNGSSFSAPAFLFRASRAWARGYGQFSSGPGCVSAAINTSFRYQQVCGWVARYQNDDPDGFAPFYRTVRIYWSIYAMQLLIKFPLMDCQSCMALLIKTFGLTLQDSVKAFLTMQIVHVTMNLNSLEPLPYIGNNYYCESGNSTYECKIFHNSDTLWDGQQCGGAEAPCCTHPNMLWFIKTLSETTTEDIELRVCTTNEACNGTVPIFLIELYIQ